MYLWFPTENKCVNDTESAQGTVLWTSEDRHKNNSTAYKVSQTDWSWESKGYTVVSIAA